MEMAHLEILMKKMDQAIDTAEGLQRDLPDSALGFTIEGDVRMALKQYREAQTAYERALSLQKNGRLIAKLYRAQNLSGDHQAGIATLKQWLEQHPNDLYVLKTLSDAWIGLGKIRQAIETAEKIRQLAPDDPGNLNNLANLYHRIGNKQALETARRALELAPGNPFINDTLGWLLVENGEPARGLPYLREAQTRNSRIPAIRYHIAAALHQLGRDQQALDELTALLQNDVAFAEKPAAQALLEKLSQE